MNGIIKSAFVTNLDPQDFNNTIEKVIIEFQKPGWNVEITHAMTYVPNEGVLYSALVLARL
jgi:hypothetical protein